MIQQSSFKLTLSQEAGSLKEFELMRPEIMVGGNLGVYTWSRDGYL